MVVLVDGGQSTADDANSNELYKAIERHCPGIDRRIDIAICTHRDRDHAGGFPAFIRAWLSCGNEIGEFWLPGAWSGAVERVLVDPDAMVSMLAHGASMAADNARKQNAQRMRDATSAPTRLRSIDTLISEMRSSCREEDRSAREDRSYAVSEPTPSCRRPDVDESPVQRSKRAAASWGFEHQVWQEIACNLESSSLQAASLFELLDRRTKWWWWWLHSEWESDPLATTLTANAIETAETIRAIASAAVSFDIPVRWFDFELFEDGQKPFGGYPGFLIPLNAVEVSAAPRQDDALVLFLKLTLTEQNVASLVFQRVETELEPGVIFVADSRLAFGIDLPKKDFLKYIAPITRPIVYTAAHHGSRNNDHAYKVLAGWLGKLFSNSIAIRNGGVWNQSLTQKVVALGEVA